MTRMEAEKYLYVVAFLLVSPYICTCQENCLDVSCDFDTQIPCMSSNNDEFQNTWMQGQTSQNITPTSGKYAYPLKGSGSNSQEAGMTTCEFNVYVPLRVSFDYIITHHDNHLQVFRQCSEEEGQDFPYKPSDQQGLWHNVSFTLGPCHSDTADGRVVFRGSAKREPTVAVDNIVIRPCNSLASSASPSSAESSDTSPPPSSPPHSQDTSRKTTTPETGAGTDSRPRTPSPSPPPPRLPSPPSHPSPPVTSPPVTSSPVTSTPSPSHTPRLPPPLPTRPHLSPPHLSPPHLSPPHSHPQQTAAGTPRSSSAAASEVPPSSSSLLQLVSSSSPKCVAKARSQLRPKTVCWTTSCPVLGQLPIYVLKLRTFRPSDSSAELVQIISNRVPWTRSRNQKSVVRNCRRAANTFTSRTHGQTASQSPPHPREPQPQTSACTQRTEGTWRQGLQ
ncbi:uncharacterized protein LOC143282128 isoform X7 [Babylonia areolata]|uniref:uncharacterized protein LOC143282128 isoform X7 n=1 Tax=Babylonia areolata TaxID=304850 RepID=UPI003FD5FB27